MGNSSRSGRLPFLLRDSINHKLNRYALAAGAAGVSAMALSTPAEAKIVYTHAHRVVGRYGIDFNHDHTPDMFVGRAAGEGKSIVFASADPRVPNGVAVVTQNSPWATALPYGAKVGPARSFKGDTYFPLMATVYVFQTKSQSYWGGPWANGGKGVKNRYLGARFKINGKFHYGWARITLKIDDPRSHRFSSVVLTGYAYETVPNKPIIAGKTNDPDVITTGLDAVGTLGHLAIGRK
jgi:hypothetical protein